MTRKSVRVSELVGGTHGVPRVKIWRDAENAFCVEWEPPELAPFALRYRWWSMVDEELEDDDPLKYVEWPVGPPEAIPPPDAPAKWAWHHERTLTENALAYRLYAEQLRGGQIPGAIHKRMEMLAESQELEGAKYGRMRPDQLPNTYLVALVRQVEELRKAGWTVVEIGHRQMVDKLTLRTLNRRLAEARQRGLLLRRERTP